MRRMRLVPVGQTGRLAVVGSAASSLLMGVCKYYRRMIESLLTTANSAS